MKKIFKAIGNFFIHIIGYIIIFIDFLDKERDDERKIVKVIREVFCVIIAYLYFIISILLTPGNDVKENAWWEALILTIVAYAIFKLIIAFTDKKKKKNKSKDDKKVNDNKKE